MYVLYKKFNSYIIQCSTPDSPSKKLFLEVAAGSTNGMRTFQSLLLFFNLAVFLQCQAVPASDFFVTDGLIGNADNSQAVSPILATFCGEASLLEVCFQKRLILFG